MIEEERQGIHVVGDPEQEAKTWQNKLAQADRRRSRFQDMAAEGHITLEELGEKLSGLEEIRSTAVDKLEAMHYRRELIEGME